jgi:hypothetical protein
MAKAWEATRVPTLRPIHIFCRSVDTAYTRSFVVALWGRFLFFWSWRTSPARVRAQGSVRDDFSSIADRAEAGLRVTHPSSSGVNAIVGEDIPSVSR